jgi:hypothetical protein
LVYYVKPTKDHQDLFEWETANSVIFVRAEEPGEGMRRAGELLRSHDWQPIRLILHDPLSERRVVEQGGDVLAAYRVAEKTGISGTFFPETFGPGGKKQRRILSPELGEAFLRIPLEVRSMEGLPSAAFAWKSMKNKPAP